MKWELYGQHEFVVLSRNWYLVWVAEEMWQYEGEDWAPKGRIELVKRYIREAKGIDCFITENGRMIDYTEVRLIQRIVLPDRRKFQ